MSSSLQTAQCWTIYLRRNVTTALLWNIVFTNAVLKLLLLRRHLCFPYVVRKHEVTQLMFSWICILHILQFSTCVSVGWNNICVCQWESSKLSSKLFCFALVMRILQCEINFELVRHRGLVCTCRLPRCCLSQTAATTAFLTLCLTCLQKPLQGRLTELCLWSGTGMLMYRGAMGSIWKNIQGISHQVYNDAGRCQTSQKNPVYNTFKPSHTELVICVGPLSHS